MKRQEGELLVLCRQAVENGVELPEGTCFKVSCVQELGFRFLLSVWASGLQRTLVYGADCSRCTIESRSENRDGFMKANRILGVAGREPLDRVCLEKPAFRNEEQAFREASLSARGTSRRGFLKDMVATTLDTTFLPFVEKRKEEGQNRAEKERGSAAFLEALEVLSMERGQEREGRLAAYRIGVSPTACYGCRVCALLCPTGALTWEENGSSHADARLTIDPSRCHGCNACRDLCNVGAIGIEFDPDFRVQESIPFHEKRCHSCDRTFLSSSETSHHCPGCRRRDQVPSIFGPISWG